MKRMVLVLGLLYGQSLGAQCVGDLPAELDGLARVVQAVITAARPDSGKVRNEAVRRNVADPALFAGEIAKAGATTGCLRERHEAFRIAAIAGLAAKDTIVSIDDVRAVLSKASATALADRYQASDRFSLVVGVGFGAVLQEGDNEHFKIVSRREASGATGNATDSLFIVRESDSRVIPHVSTGILVRFRERQATFSGRRRTLDYLLPTAAFASAQLTGGESGPVNGTVIGLGWTVVGGATILVGYSSFRAATLREDLRSQWLATANGRLPLVSGETEESILGTEIINAITFSLALPISFRSAFSR